MSFHSIIKPATAPIEENLSVSRSKRLVRAHLRIWTVKDGDFVVSLIPSLSLSGYGKDKGSSMVMLNNAIHDYCANLVNLKQDKIEAELARYGWSRLNKFLKKRYVGPFIDKEGVLREFSLPENTEVDEEILEVC